MILIIQILCNLKKNKKFNLIKCFMKKILKNYKKNYKIQKFKMNKLQKILQITQINNQK